MTTNDIENNNRLTESQKMDAMRKLVADMEKGLGIRHEPRRDLMELIDDLITAQYAS